MVTHWKRIFIAYILGIILGSICRAYFNSPLLGLLLSITPYIVIRLLGYPMFKVEND